MKYFTKRDYALFVLELSVKARDDGKLEMAQQLRNYGLYLLRVARVMHMRGGYQYAGR